MPTAPSLASRKRKIQELQKAIEEEQRALRSIEHKDEISRVENHCDAVVAMHDNVKKKLSGLDFTATSIDGDTSFDVAFHHHQKHLERKTNELKTYVDLCSKAVKMIKTLACEQIVGESDKQTSTLSSLFSQLSGDVDAPEADEKNKKKDAKKRKKNVSHSAGRNPAVPVEVPALKAKILSELGATFQDEKAAQRTAGVVINDMAASQWTTERMRKYLKDVSTKEGSRLKTSGVKREELVQMCAEHIVTDMIKTGAITKNQICKQAMEDEDGVSEEVSDDDSEEVSDGDSEDSDSEEVTDGEVTDGEDVDVE